MVEAEPGAVHDAPAGLLNTTTSASSIPGDPGPDSAGSANRWSKSVTPLSPNADPGTWSVVSSGVRPNWVSTTAPAAV